MVRGLKGLKKNLQYILYALKFLCSKFTFLFKMLIASLHGQSRGWTAAGNHNEIQRYFLDL